MTRPSTGPLRLVPAAAPAAPPRSFCSHCGHPAGDEASSAGRVCGHCSLGLVLHAPAGVAPSPSDPFLVANRQLAVCALSAHAERLLGAPEPEAVDRPLGEMLVSAELGSSGQQNLAAALLAAVDGRTEPVHVVVRPPDVFGVRYWARIGPCGPPTAAVVVLADAR